MQTRKVITTLAGAIALSGAAHAGEVLDSVKVVDGADFTAKGKNTVSVRFAGRTEFEYSTAGSDDGFSFRRLRLGAKAKLGSGFTAETIVDYAADAGRRGKSSATSIRKAIVSYKLNDIVKIQVGRDKVVFGYEETSSSSKGVFLERSALNNELNDSFSGGGLAYGVQNNITIKTDLGHGFSADASIADGTTESGTDGADKTAFYGRIQWANDSFVVGADYADADTNSGYTAYVNYQANGLNLLAEYFDADLESSADIDGYALRASYKFGKIEPVVRYSEYDSGTVEVEEIYAGVNFYAAPQVTILTGYQDIDRDGQSSESLTARLRLLW